MKINIYYGGRGVIDDPTLAVLGQVEQILGELRVEIGRYNIYEYKNAIPTLTQTMRDVDGVILATTVEWLGIGGYMTQFLDSLWLYGDKSEFGNIYMQPIVISTTYGEREAILTLENAWEILGGQICDGLCGYAENLSEFRQNPVFSKTIEKKVENFYRTISHKTEGLPSSNQAVKRSVLRKQTMDLTPQESEKLSQYVADESYVSQQKQDIMELSSVYRNMLGDEKPDVKTDYINIFKARYRPISDFSATYAFMMDDEADPMVVAVRGDYIECGYRQIEGADVMIKLTPSDMNEITSGRMTFTRAFNSGTITMKGDFDIMRKLDDVFVF